MRIVPVGKIVSVIGAETVASASLVAVTIAVVTEATLAGGVYKPPAVSVPIEGLIDHVTPVLEDPCTQAVNCWDGVPACMYLWGMSKPIVTPKRTTRLCAVRPPVTVVDTTVSAPTLVSPEVAESIKLDSSTASRNAGVTAALTSLKAETTLGENFS